MHPNDGRVVSSFIVQALRGEPITVFGDGTQTRSFCYVDDMVEAIRRFMTTDVSVTGPMNLGNQEEISVGDLARTIVDLTGSRSKIVMKPLPVDDPLRRRPDIALAERVLEWRPTTALSDGLKLTISYFETGIADN